MTLIQPKEITVTSKGMYRLTVGHDGYTSGCGYDGSDYFSDTFYGNTHEEIIINLLNADYTTLEPGNQCDYEYWQIFEYEGTIIPIKRIMEFNKWEKSNGRIIQSEAFNRLNFEISKPHNQEIIAGIKERYQREQQQQLEDKKKKDNEITEAKEKEDYFRLKKKFETNQ